MPRHPKASPVLDDITAKVDVDDVISDGAKILTGIVRKPTPYNPTPIKFPIVLKMQNGVLITW
jgi:hypothetical protein